MQSYPSVAFSEINISLKLFLWVGWSQQLWKFNICFIQWNFRTGLLFAFLRYVAHLEGKKKKAFLVECTWRESDSPACVAMYLDIKWWENVILNVYHTTLVHTSKLYHLLSTYCVPGINMFCILIHTSGGDQTWAYLPSDPCSALNSGVWPGGRLSQSPGCSGFLLGLAYGGTSGRLEENGGSQSISSLSVFLKHLF